MDVSKHESNQKKVSLIIILDEEASVYLAQVAGTEMNQYIVRLLQEEKQRQTLGRSDQRKNDNEYMNEVISDTPDTSGYPEMTGHFKPVE